MEVITFFDLSLSGQMLTIYFLTFSIFFYFLYNNFLARRLSRLPPGPRPFPVVGNLPSLGPAPHQALSALARVHGPLMHLWLGSKHVVVASSGAVAEQFLKTHDVNFASRPPTAAARLLAYDCQSLVFRPYGPRWNTLRKICKLHLFSQKAMDDFRPIREEEVKMMAISLATEEAKEVQLAKVLNLCVTNAIGRVIIGKKVFGKLPGKTNPKADAFKEMVVELTGLAGAINIGDFIPVLEWLDVQGLTKKMHELHKRLDTFVSQILEEHKADKSHTMDHSDFLTLMISLKDGKQSKLTDDEIKVMLADLFIAGTDVPLSTLEWTIAELIRHPDIMTKVQEEIDSVVGPNRLVTENDLSSLTYLQAVMKEVLRLHPPSALSIPRIATESVEINGYHIPKNAILLVNIWGMSRSLDAWDNPLEFRPNRFLPGGECPNLDIRGNDFKLIPFGAGRRICAGMNLGLVMVQFITATLVHAFDLELPHGQTAEELNMEEAFGLALQRKVPLVVYPKPRLPSHAYNL